MAGKVFVSGGSGYIGGYIIRQLVNEGWMVHTSIRNLARESETRKSLDVDDSKVRFFAAELLDDAGWADAMAGCTHVAHVASPIPVDVPKDENELIAPARDGALRALRFAKAAGVKRFVMTSSVAAIGYGHGGTITDFTEAYWTNVDSPDTQPYAKSKTIAERAARDWMASEGGDMEYCSVNPALVLGPVQGADFSPSLEAVKKLLEGSFPGIPDLGFGLVDVRDVADLHVRALTAPDMANQRFICSGPFVKLAEIAAILKSNLGDEARKVPTINLPNFLVRLSSYFDPIVKQIIPELGNVRNMDASHARDKLGWVPRPHEQTIVDTARSLIDGGLVNV